jgi:hypothetical protein
MTDFVGDGVAQDLKLKVLSFSGQLLDAMVEEIGNAPRHSRPAR